MRKIWKKILAEIKNISPETYNSLNSSASEEDINLLENVLEVKLPDDFKNYLRVCNGQNHKDNTIFFVSYNCLLSISEIIKDWQMMNYLFSDEEIIEHINENKIKPFYWNKKRIPFACFNGDHRWILDLDCGKNGKNGQIFVLHPGVDLEDDECVIADSFAEFSQKILKSLKNNAFKIDDGMIDFEWL